VSKDQELRTLERDYNDCCKNLDKFVGLLSQINLLPVKYTKFVAEIIFLRTFSMLEESIISIACKIVCGNFYCDGNVPNLLVQASSRADAIEKMMRVGRSRPKYQLTWTKSGEIRDNLKFMLPQTETFMLIMNYHGNFLDEMRRVRNRIAHNNRKSRRDYRIVVQRYYGAPLNNISPGTLLLSNRISPPLLMTYLAKCRIFVKQIVRA
jgi:hypothetical protein